MDTPRLALRFRDPSPTVDTIREHRQLIEQRGAVWWGWWKKDSEELPAELIEEVGKNACKILLIDRSARKCYRAACARATLSSSKRPNAADVPRYYRRILNDIPVWFVLTQIDDIEYTEPLERLIGDGTFVALETANEAAPGEADRAPGAPNAAAATVPVALAAEPVLSPEAITAPDRGIVLHLSDLHFGKDHGFRPPNETPDPFEQRKTLVESLLADLQRLKLAGQVGAVVVTGDLTTQGDWSDETLDAIVEEMKRLAQALKIDARQIIVMPGNHDMIRYPAGTSDVKATIDHFKDYKHERDFRLFADKLTGRFRRGSLNRIYEIELQQANLQLCALNSCSIVSCGGWTEYGYVGDGGSYTLARLKEARIVRPTYRVMALHHHLLPVAQIEVASSKEQPVNGVSLTLDAVKLLDAASDAGVQLALHGHQHIPRITEYRRFVPRNENDAGGRLFIASAGSASVASTRRALAGRNTYSLLAVKADGVDLRIRELLESGAPGHFIYEETLPLRPLNP